MGYLEHEGALIADFAEYYHIYDWTALPIDTAAALAAGLRPAARSYMKANGTHATTEQALLANIFDALQVLIYQHEGKKKKQPKLIAKDIISGAKEQKAQLKQFGAGSEFEDAWRTLNG